MRQKQYCIQNEQLTKEEYRKRRSELHLGSAESVARIRKSFEAFLRTQPRRALQTENCENCTGNYIRNARNCAQVFHCYDAEDCRYGEHIWRGAKNCVDCNSAGRDAELGYESTNSGIGSYNIKFCRYCWGCRDTEYSDQCKQGFRLFGCVSLKPGAQFCILNKQYPENEWTNLVAKIKDKMRSDNEYGEFFPLSISPFGYNDSISYDAFPLEMMEVKVRGWKWEDAPVGTYDQETLKKIPDAIEDADDAICSEILVCAETGENYKITPHELLFYREEGIPLPSKAPMKRLRDRIARRPKPFHLYQRTCAQCSKEIETTYSPERPEKVVCEECFLKEVY